MRKTQLEIPIPLPAALSDSTGEPKPPWKERKVAYLEHLAAYTLERRVLLYRYLRSGGRAEGSRMNGIIREALR